MIQYTLKEEYIELYKLLKILQLAQTGGHAKLMIEEGEVKLNNEPEFRKRAKIRQGDKVECSGNIIQII
jgi:ribosome-associated protein